MADENSRLNIPVPDPSLLTTEQLRREIGELKEQTKREILATRELLEEKIISNTALFHQITEANRLARVAALDATRDLTNAMNVAHDAAISKSEAAFTKEIDSLKGLIGTSIAATNDRIAAVVGRLDRGEGASKGADDRSAQWMAGIALLISVLFGAYQIIRPAQPSSIITAPAIVPVQPSNGHQP